MLNSPLVSILLPVHNGERTLRETLDSLLGQSFTNYELLIGIDGTFDSSKKIALSYNDPRIKIIQQPKNLGLAENLNEIIKYASESSCYFAMAEQDDIYMPDRLELQVNTLNKKPNIGLVSAVVELNGQNNSVLFPGMLLYNKQFPLGREMFVFTYTTQLKVVNTCIMWRKKVHQSNDLKFRNTYGNFNVDWDFILRFALVSDIYGYPKKLAVMNRFIHNNSITLNNKRAQFKASRQLLKDFKKEFPELISPKIFNKAQKHHRKVELGHYPKLKLIGFGIYYFLKYLDVYFLKYLVFRLTKYINNKK